MNVTTKKASMDGPTVADAMGEEVPEKRPKARAYPVKVHDPDRPPEHEHPRGVVDVITGVDDQGRRVIGSVPARVPKYKFDCPRCVWEDEKRMNEPPTLTEEELETTLFLVPEPKYDIDVCRAYVAKRYPGKRNVTSSFNAERLSYVRAAQIVVISRRGANGQPVGPGSKRQKDEEGKFVDFPVPPETYLNEVVESAPIVVAECMDVIAATMLSEGSVDMRELVARLHEHTVPYRIALPTHKDDKLYIMRGSS